VAFDEFIAAGDRQLEVSNGFCSLYICNNQCSGYRFSSTRSGLYFDLIIDIKEGQVTDVYECKSFNSLAADLRVRKRVLIDRNKLVLNLDKNWRDN
jgi:hypothetical protein